jgi:hypothetical protein
LRRFFVLGIAALVLGVGTLPARATTVTLESLLTAGATFTNGDKVFSDFTYTATGNMPDASAVNISTITDIFGNLGIRIQGGFSALVGTTADAAIGYDVTTTGGLISDVHLIGNPTVVGGGGVMTITEQVAPVLPGPPPTVLGNLNIFAIGGGAVQSSDVLVLSTDYTTLQITKDILAISTGGVPTASIIDQTFSQVPSVPEPTTLCGAGIAVFFGLACAWRRRRAKAA